MKIAALVSRYVLGLIFTVFGLNGFFHFLPMTPMPPLAEQFVVALVQSHFMTAVFALELGAGILLLVSRYVPLALTVLAPIIVNILLFHITMAPAGLPLAAVVTVLWLVVASRLQPVFATLFHPVTGTEGVGHALPHAPSFR